MWWAEAGQGRISRENITINGLLRFVTMNDLFFNRRDAENAEKIFFKRKCLCVLCASAVKSCTP
jgi:hypothetical protein